MGSWVRTQVTRLDDRYLYSGHLNGPKVSLLQNGTKIPLLQLNDNSLITSNLKSIWFPDHLDHFSLRSCFESGFQMRSTHKTLEYLGLENGTVCKVPAVWIWGPECGSPAHTYAHWAVVLLSPRAGEAETTDPWNVWSASQDEWEKGSSFGF